MERVLNVSGTGETLILVPKALARFNSSGVFQREGLEIGKEAFMKIFVSRFTLLAASRVRICLQLGDIIGTS